jgi:hypothetical protein
MSAPPTIVPVGPCVCRFLTQVLLWFDLELPRIGIAKGGGIHDVLVKVHPVDSGGPRPRETATVRPLR